jgi:hypothetical protein
LSTESENRTLFGPELQVSLRPYAITLTALFEEGDRLRSIAINSSQGNRGVKNLI